MAQLGLSLLGALLTPGCVSTPEDVEQDHATTESVPRLILSSQTEQHSRLSLERRSLKAEGSVLMPVGLDIQKRNPDGSTAPLSHADLIRLEPLIADIYRYTSEHDRPDLLGLGLSFDVRVRNGELAEFRAQTAGGTALEVGQIGVDGKHPTIQPSWYVNLLTERKSGPDSAVDYVIKAQLGYVKLNARYFADEARPTGPLSMLDLAEEFGVSREDIRSARSYLSYEDPFQAQGFVVTSLLAQVGRAYNLIGPVDLSWTVGNLTKVIYVAPNLTFDETLGIRIRLAEGDALNLGIFAGTTQNISPVGNDLVHEIAVDTRIESGIHIENAPHATIALWGLIPGTETNFYAALHERRNTDTLAREVELALSALLAGRPLTLRGSYSREQGAGIAFDREKARASLEYQITECARAFIAYERDHARYGSAELESDSALVGVSIDFGGGSARITAEQLFGAAYSAKSTVPPRQMQQLLSELHQGMSYGLQASDAAVKLHGYLQNLASQDPSDLPDQLPELHQQVQVLSQSLAALSPDTAAALVEQISGYSLTDSQKDLLNYLVLAHQNDARHSLSELESRVSEILERSPDSLAAAQARLSEILNSQKDSVEFYQTHRDDLQRLLSHLTSPRIWDAVVAHGARSALIKKLSQEQEHEIPLIGSKLIINAPTLLAAANAMQSRLSPLRPAQHSDIHSWLVREAGETLGIEAENVTAEMVADRLVELAVDKTHATFQEHLDRHFAELGDLQSYDREGLVEVLFNAVPAEVRDRLEERFGENLRELLPPDLSIDQLRRRVSREAPGILAEYLKETLRPEVQRRVQQMLSFTSDVLEREYNMTMLRLLLASEELDKLTVDKGEKLDRLDVRMAMRSFDLLDQRNKRLAHEQRTRIKDLLIQEETREQIEALQERKVPLEATGLRSAIQSAEDFATLQASTVWPDGLQVLLDQETWDWLIANYGEDELYQLLARIKSRYELSPKSGGFSYSFSFDKDGDGTRSRYSYSSAEIELAPPGNEQEKRSGLSGIEIHGSQF